jgi:hypothetical protein
MTSSRHLRAPLALLVLVGSASCTSSLELDRFHKTEATSVDTAIAVNYFDVQFGARGMTSHLNEMLEIRVVDRDNHVQAKAIYNDVASVDFSIYLARVVPKANAPYRLDFWADHNNTSRYDGIQGGINEKDHAWRRVLADPLPDDMRLTGARYTLDFIHDTAFVDIGTDLQGAKVTIEDTLLPFSLKIAGAGGHVGKMIEVRVIDRASTRLVGLYRQGRAKESYSADIAGILDEQTGYDVTVYVDANGDGKYDPSDPSWKLDLESDSNGLTAALDLASAPQAPIETGAP